MGLDKLFTGVEVFQKLDAIAKRVPYKKTLPAVDF
jgi:hypothetical protein